MRALVVVVLCEGQVCVDVHLVVECRGSEDMDFFFQAEDGIRVLVRSRGLGDVYKRQADSITAVSAARMRMSLVNMAGCTSRSIGTACGFRLSLIHI